MNPTQNPYKKKTYVVDANNPPTLRHQHHSSPIVCVERDNVRKGWSLLDSRGREVNFVPDGTEWLK